MTKNYFAPEANKTKYLIGIANSSQGEFEVNEVTREGSNFYVRKVENEPESANELENEPESVNEPDFFADIRELACFLKDNNAVWMVEKKNKFRSKIMFLNKQQAFELLRDGVPVFHLESGQIISFSKGYDELLSSVSGKVSELLPGSYMVAVGEPWNPKTYKEVQEENEAVIAEKQEAEAKEIARLQEEARKAKRQTEAEKLKLESEKQEAVKIARQKEHARINAEKKVAAARIEIETLKSELGDVKAKASTAAKKPKKGFKYWLERAGYVLGGVALGAVIVNHKK